MNVADEKSIPVEELKKHGKDEQGVDVQLDDRCPLCFPTIITTSGKKFVAWRFAGIQVSMTLDRALELIAHINGGLVKQAFGINLAEVAQTTLAEIRKQSGVVEPETKPTKEFVN